MSVTQGEKKRKGSVRGDRSGAEERMTDRFLWSSCSVYKIVFLTDLLALVFHGVMCRSVHVQIRGQGVCLDSLFSARLSLVIICKSS